MPPRSVIERGAARRRVSVAELGLVWLSGALIGVLAGLIIAAAVIL